MKFITRAFTKLYRVFTKSAAARILGVTGGQIVRVQEFLNCILVVGRHFCRFVSKSAFLKAYRDFRIQGSESVELQVNTKNHLGDRIYTASKSQGHGFYTVSLNTQDKYLNCTCEDYQQALESFPGKATPPCKHLYKALSLNGYGSLQAFIKS